MTKFLNWWKQDGRWLTLLKSLLLGLLPVACCLVYCAVRGRSIGEVYLPESEWNDELFYYKQVEGIVNYGYPQGYFGFNESHGLKLSFAAWSPVLVFPWILWGLLFGWNLMSPVLCNIVLLSLACFLFVWLARPDWKQTGILVLLFCLYTPFVRYMLSVMPEVICFSLLIVFYGLAFSYLDREKSWKLALLFVLASVMTLMRPYLLLFLLLPAWLWGKKRGWKGVWGSLVVVGATLGGYAAIKHYFGAEYFAPLFFTDWAEAFLEQGFFGGIRFTLGKLYYMGRSFLAHTVQGVKTGLCSGAYFAGYLVCLLLLAGQSLADFRSLKKVGNMGGKQGTVPEGGKDTAPGVERETAPGGKQKAALELKKKLTVEVHLLLCFVGMLFALLLMYKLTEGSKHLLTFMAAAVFVISMMNTRYFKKAAVLGVTFAYLYTVMALDPYDYQVPFVQQESRRELETWTQQLEGRMTLWEQEVPNYENSVIWVFSDVVEGTSVNTRWQLLYGLPKGFGISCCMREYVLENFDTLQSRYLCVTPGGDVEKKCIAAGYEKLAGNDRAVIYQRY